MVRRACFCLNVLLSFVVGVLLSPTTTDPPNPVQPTTDHLPIDLPTHRPTDHQPINPPTLRLGKRLKIKYKQNTNTTGKAILFYCLFDE